MILDSRGGTGCQELDSKVRAQVSARVEYVGRTKVCLQVTQMMFFAASFVFVWLLAVAGPLAAFLSRFC